ncbi:Putative cation exchanger C3A12,06c [Rhizoctonia solani AG-1 IB]|uniref:Putative cation exchanger C3A12,06c n=1 Tax=Thanatephorus cucumeris (strain AG1-IB / isolate 7/3/14) TaxID=1108050 RepID=M5BPD0_THACB|nr:Putative cation exchanger C3A12,06c [Rhizoctonia solani AG-1 IB]
MVILPVFALIAQAFLWANSRYADVTTVHSLATATVSAASNVTIVEDFCEPLSFPLAEQCSHVRRPDRDIGICASDFFCPNLATIASTLGLNENVAGVTFLAFGNGSPDLFSTFSAMRAGSGSLAIGELLGAASFIVSVVAGSMPLVRPFRVNPACILVILIDGEIHAWEALAMVGLYLVYVCVVVGGSWIENRRQRLANREALIRGEYADTPTDPAGQTTFEPYRDEDYSPLPTPSVRTRAHSNPAVPPGQDTLAIPSSHTRARPALHIPHDSDSRASSASASPLTSSRSTSHVHQLPSFSLLGALEFRTVVNSLHGSSTAGTLNMFDAPVSPYAAGHYRRLSIVSSRSSASSVRRGATTAPPAMEASDPEEQRDPWDVAFNLQLSERGAGGTNNGAALAPAAEIHRAKSPVPSIHIFSPSSPGNGAGPAASRKLFVPEDGPAEPQWKLVLRQVMHTLFPSLVDLSSRPWLWKLVALLSVNLSLIRRMELEDPQRPCLSTTRNLT